MNCKCFNFSHSENRFYCIISTSTTIFTATKSSAFGTQTVSNYFNSSVQKVVFYEHRNVLMNLIKFQLWVWCSLHPQLNPIQRLCWTLLSRKSKTLNAHCSYPVSKSQTFLYELKELFKLNDFRYHKSLCFKYLFRIQALNLYNTSLFGSEIAEKFLTVVLIIECELYDWMRFDFKWIPYIFV